MSKAALRQERFEALEAFLLGTMPEGDRVRFEEELEADPQLKDELEAMRENVLAVELGAFSKTLKSVVASVAEDDGRNAQNGFSWGGVLKYAAVVALVFGAAAWFFLQPSPNERLYAEYHVTDPGLPVPMSLVDDAAFHDAMVSFKEGAFADAQRKWSGLLNERPTNDTLGYFLAQTYLENDDPKAALPLLKKVAADTSSIFRGKAQWSLFLLGVRLNDPVLLDSIALEADPTYGERVRAIRAQLDH